MFGWLKRWQAARAKRAGWEVEMGMERTVAMARAIDKRRALEQQKAQAASAQTRAERDAAWTHSWEVARQAEAERLVHARTVVRELAEQRAVRQGLRYAPASDSPPAPDNSMMLAAIPQLYSGGASDSPASASCSSASSTDSGSSDGGGGCGGGD